MGGECQSATATTTNVEEKAKKKKFQKNTLQFQILSDLHIEFRMKEMMNMKENENEENKNNITKKSSSLCYQIPKTAEYLALLGDIGLVMDPVLRRNRRKEKNDRKESGGSTNDSSKSSDSGSEAEVDDDFSPEKDGKTKFGSYSSMLEMFLKDISPRYKEVWYVMGNHEAYGSSLLYARAFFHKLQREIPNFVFLDRRAHDVTIIKHHGEEKEDEENEPTLPSTNTVIDENNKHNSLNKNSGDGEKDGEKNTSSTPCTHAENILQFRILGCTLWTELRKEVEARRFCNDFYQISDMTVEKYNAEHQKCVTWLQEECQKAQAEGKTIIILTHHAPTTERSTPAEAHFFEIQVGLGASPLHLLFHENSVPNLSCWCFGHTHWNMDDLHGGVRFVTNQVGYPKDEYKSYQGFDEADLGKVIAVAAKKKRKKPQSVVEKGGSGENSKKEEEQK